MAIIAMLVWIVANVIIGLLGLLIPSRLELQYTNQERQAIWGVRLRNSPNNFDFKSLISFFNNISIVFLLIIAIIFFKIFMIDYLNLTNSERNIGDFIMIVSVVASYFIRYQLFKSKLLN